MIRRFQSLLSMFNVASSMLTFSGLAGFASVALAEIPVAPKALSPEIVKEEFSDGSQIQIGEGVSITPIKGWRIERKSMGMSLVMKEVLPDVPGAVDYSKPKFARNVTVMALPEARPIDDSSIEEIKSEISKMIARDSSLKNFSFTDAKLFDYHGKNDGMVLFSQLAVNGYQMMQMQIVVSGEKKSYLMTYSDLAANFSNPSSYEAAWKSMTSIVVNGTAPVRFEKEIFIGGLVSATFLIVMIPFFLIRWFSARRIRNLANELQHDWDTGEVKSDSEYGLSEIQNLEPTKPIKKVIKGSKKFSPKVFDMDLSSMSPTPSTFV